MMRQTIQYALKRFDRDEKGSGLLLAIFALTLLTSIGIALLFVSQTDVEMGQVDHQTKRVFFGSEAALEHGRETLRQWNIASGDLDLGQEVVQAAGANGVIDFDPALAEPIYDTNGNITGWNGVGDDVPLQNLTTYDGGTYSAYLTNDPAEGRTTLTDANKRVLVTGLAVTDDQSFEMVEAIVDHLDPGPLPNAAITILGPNPTFEGGSSAAKFLSGDDCSIPGLSVPVVGLIGSSAEAQAEAGVTQPSTYVSGTDTGVDTVEDISSTIDSRYLSCDYMVDLAKTIQAIADVDGDVNTPNSELGVPGSPKTVFINDDYEVQVNFNGAGILWVTGQLIFNGNVNWEGIIFVVGEGNFLRNGAGTNDILGGSVVANVSGPDQILWTGDDCSGPDGISGNSDDGYDAGTWWVNGSGTGDTLYCKQDINYYLLNLPFNIVDFQQH